MATFNKDNSQVTRNLLTHYICKDAHLHLNETKWSMLNHVEAIEIKRIFLTETKEKIFKSKRSICDLMVDHFKSVFRTDTLEPVQRIDSFNQLIAIQIDFGELILSLRKLDDNVKSGPDQIPPFFLRRCIPSLAKPILQLFNKSLSTGIFPSSWKNSYIYPIYKSGDKAEVQNYRPISILSTLAKVFESIVTSRLSDFLLLSIADSQHGFVKGRSVLSNLLIYNDFIFDAFKSRSQVDSVYFDFSKAFDTVNHDRLLGKVWNAGIRGTLFRWLGSYLVGRSQTVRTCGAESHSFQPTSGVPQGSNLGPLLFCIYINDLSDCLSSCKILLYADDAKLYLVVENINDSLKLQRDINKFLHWAAINGLSVNSSKCFFVSFARSQLQLGTSYLIHNSQLEGVDSMRDLGVVFDSKMTFGNQIEIVVNKCLRTLGFIKNVSRDFRSASTLVKLYKSLLLPILTFCSPIWLPHTENALSELVSIEHKFLRFVSKLTPAPMRFDDHDYTPIRKLLNLTPLRTIFLKNDYILAFKISHNSINSSIVNDLFSDRNLTYNLRNPRPLQSSHSSRDYINFSTTFRLRHLWNLLPLELRTLPTLAQFKRKIHEHLMR